MWFLTIWIRPKSWCFENRISGFQPDIRYPAGYPVSRRIVFLVSDKKKSSGKIERKSKELSGRIVVKSGIRSSRISGKKNPDIRYPVKIWEKKLSSQSQINSYAMKFSRLSCNIYQFLNWFFSLRAGSRTSPWRTPTSTSPWSTSGILSYFFYNAAYVLIIQKPLPPDYNEENYT